MKLRNLKFVIPSVAIALLLHSEASVLSQEHPGCFMIDDEEEFIDLSNLCPTPPPPPVSDEPVLGTGDVQVTLRWATTDDLDLAVSDPAGEQADFTNTRVSSGGELDVDSNAGCAGTTTSPVENIFWPTGGAPTGDYVAKVNFYSRCQSSVPEVSFAVTILAGGNVQEFTGQVSSENETITFPFSYPGNVEPETENEE